MVALRRARNAAQIVASSESASPAACQVRRELPPVGGVVVERELLGGGLEEEVERIDHRHLGDEIDLDAKLARLLREHEPREVVRLRVLLPVDEVFGGRDLERIGQDPRAAMRRRTKPDDLRPERRPGGRSGSG